MSLPHLGHLRVDGWSIISSHWSCVSNIMGRFYHACVGDSALIRNAFHNCLNAFVHRGYYTLPVSHPSICIAPTDVISDASHVAALQRRRLRDLLREVGAANPFYRAKL